MNRQFRSELPVVGAAAEIAVGLASRTAKFARSSSSAASEESLATFELVVVVFEHCFFASCCTCCLYRSRRPSRWLASRLQANKHAAWVSAPHIVAIGPAQRQRPTSRTQVTRKLRTERAEFP